MEVLAAPTTVTGSASLDAGANTLAADGAVALSGAASLTQGADTSSAAGAVAILGDASLTQGTDSASAAGAVAIQGTASLTQEPTRWPLMAGWRHPGDASLTQGADTASAAGVVAIAGAASLTQGAQTSAGAGAVATKRAASLTQGADVLSADGTRGVAFAPWAQHTFPITADDLGARPGAIRYSACRRRSQLHGAARYDLRSGLDLATSRKMLYRIDTVTMRQMAATTRQPKPRRNH